MEKNLMKAHRNRASLSAQLAQCRSKCQLCLRSDFQSLSPSNDDYAAQKNSYDLAAEQVLSMATRITRKVIDLDVRSRLDSERHRFTEEAVVADMVKRLFPLQAFADRPGILVGTAAKAKKSLQVLLYHEPDACCKWFEYESLFVFLRDLNTSGNAMARRLNPESGKARAITFIDEEEDSYWHLFDQHKSMVNPEGRNDLNEVIAEFHKRLDLTWPFAFETGSDRQLARKVFQNLWAFADVSGDAEKMINHERVKRGTSSIGTEESVAFLHSVLSQKWPDVCAQFNREQMGQLFRALVMTNDGHNDFRRFQQKARILQRVRDWVLTLPKNGREDDYDVFRRVRELIFDKKFFLMSRSGYGEMLDQPSQTFFNASAYIMATDHLNRLELLPETANRTIRVVFREEPPKRSAFTLLHYFQFILLVADIVSDKNGVHTLHFAKDDQKRYPNLYKFARDVRHLFKSGVHKEGLDEKALAEGPVGDDFFYAGTKSVMCLDESHRQAEEYNTTEDVALSLSIISLRDSPEEDLRDLLGENNGVYLISATGGVQPASAGTFNQRRLRQILNEIGGCYFPMTEAERVIVAERAQQVSRLRHRDVRIVDATLPQYHFPSSAAMGGLLSVFFDALPSIGAHRYDRMSRYKEHEVFGLVASLDRLLSTQLRSALCLCLSMQWARTALIGMAQSTPLVRQVDAAGHQFVIDPLFFPQHHQAGANLPIHIVLYAAGKFTRRDSSRTGAFPQPDESAQFNEEMMKALDVSDKKVLLWTAYRSAARGVNFVTTREGVELDFQMVYLVNSPFYNRHTRPRTRGFHMESFQSLLQVLLDRQNGAEKMSRTEFLYEYSRHRWQILEVEHFIDLYRTLLQSLGRVERRPDSFMELQEIFVDVEVARTLHLGSLFAPELRERASATQTAVLAQIDCYNRSTSCFANDGERARHIAESLRQADTFDRFTKRLPANFHSSVAARQLWSSMFDDRMMTDPCGYIDHLRRCGVPLEYYSTLYFRAPVWASLYIGSAGGSQGQRRVITDYADATAAYNWVGWLAPASLWRALPAPFCHLQKFTKGFVDPHSAGEHVLLPQPWFVTGIMKGYLAEQVFLHFIRSEFGGGVTVEGKSERFRLLNVLDHPAGAAIYQKYDFYIEVDQKRLLAFDIKNWTRMTDSLKKKELEHEARVKHRQLRQLFPSYEVHAFYVNLCGAHKYIYERQPPSGKISFMSMYVQSAQEANSPWTRNANLADAILRSVL
jgi:hypothetical protein